MTFGGSPIGTQYRASEDFGEIYWRMYLKSQSGWTGRPAKLNTPGCADGEFEFWIDGTRENHRTDLDWRGSYTAHGIHAVFFENCWSSGSPVEQRRHFDDLAIERIGG